MSLVIINEEEFKKRSFWSKLRFWVKVLVKTDQTPLMLTDKQYKKMKKAWDKR